MSRAFAVRPRRPGPGRRLRLEPFEDRLAPAVVTFQVSSDWGTGFVGTVRITNDQPAPINGWRLEFDFPYQLTQVWNGVIASHAGNHYAINDAGYNRTIPLGQYVEFGFVGMPGNVSGEPANYILNGVPLAGGPLPALSVSDVTVTEPNGLSMAPGFLHTSGNQIVDTAGRAVRLSGVNWFGMESSTFAPHGLWARNYQDMMDQMRDLGFNCIRLPFSDQLFDPGSTPNGIDFSLNPDLRGLTGLQVMDKIIDYAGQIGLRVILDHHRSDAGGGSQDNGLWYTSAYPESRWIADWRMLAQHYADNPTVVGADLHNEPHGPATWGGGGATDWRLAAERAGNAVLAVNPDWLIVTEGVEQGNSGFTWWGGNLSNAGAFPVRLDVPGRLIYSPHDYPASVYPQPWFSAPDYPQNLYSVWDRNWGYLFRQGTVPILLGEFGSKLETTSDRQWADAITNYLSGDLDGNGTNDLGPGQQGASWMWWSWNPDSGDTGGILQDDWVHVQQAKLDELRPVQFATGAPALATFNITLNVPSGRTVLVDYATADGTATAGADYTAVSGTLEFRPGETTKTVSVPVLADAVSESLETFHLKLSNPRNATLADADGVGTILDAGEAPPPTAGDVQVGFTVRDDWGTGFVADMTITNNRTTDITGWTLEFDFDRQITNIWNARIVSHVGTHYVIRNETWNPVIPANGGRVEFGFQGAPGNVTAGPRDYVLNGERLP